MHLLHILRAVLHCLVTRQVVDYAAEDQDLGPVRVVVEANRLTGRRVRKVYERWDDEAV